MKAYTVDKFYIPERMLPGLERYVNDGIRPGDFLIAVLENDLHKAVTKADRDNLANLFAYSHYLYFQAPSPCFGSPQIVEKWIEHGGARGYGTTTEMKA